MRVGLPSVLDDTLYYNEESEPDQIGELLQQLSPNSNSSQALDPATTPGLIPF